MSLLEHIFHHDAPTMPHMPLNEQLQAHAEAINAAQAVSLTPDAASPTPTLLQPHQEPTMSFLSKFESAFAKLFHSAPTWVHTAQTVVAFAAPVVISFLSLNSPDTAAAAQPIISEVQTDLATVSVLAGDGTATPSLSQAINRIGDNMSALLQMGHIKDDKAVANANLVIGELKALSTILPKS